MQFLCKAAENDYLATIADKCLLCILQRADVDLWMLYARKDNVKWREKILMNFFDVNGNKIRKNEKLL